jgi:hypothetical protein
MLARIFWLWCINYIYPIANRKTNRVRCEGVTELTAVSWDVTLCGSVHTYIMLSVELAASFFRAERWYLPTKLHEATYYTSNIMILWKKNNFLTFRASDEIFCTNRSYSLSFPYLPAFNVVTWETEMEKLWIRILSNHMSSQDATLRLGLFVIRFLDSRQSGITKQNKFSKLVCFRPQQGRSPGNKNTRKLGGPQSPSGRCAVQKKLLLLPGIEQRPFSP